MRVKLRLFATYRDYLPPGNDGNTAEIEVPSGTRVGELMSMFNVPIGQESVVLLNGVTARFDETFNEGDVISAFPAMAGG